jgi:hypothetical protein
MSSSSPVCGICDIRHISKSSEVWCPQCEEGMCTECIEHHSLVKLILPIISMISLIKYSMSVNIVDVFTFFIISSMIATFLQSLWFLWTTYIFRRERERTHRTPDKYSQHKKVCIRPTNIYSHKANRERSRNTFQIELYIFNWHGWW